MSKSPTCGITKFNSPNRAVIKFRSILHHKYSTFNPVANISKAPFLIHHFLIASLSLLFVFIPISIPVLAQEKEEGPVKANLVDRNGRIVAEFWIRGKLLGRLPQGKDREAFDARVENWTRRLNKIFSGNTKPQNIRTALVGGNGVVFCGAEQVLIFDPETAKLMKMTPIKLAETWAGNIRFALKSAPSFNIKESSIVVPLNETIAIKYEGNFNGDLSFYDYDPELIQINHNKSRKQIFVTGLKLGKGLFRAKAEDLEKTVYYKVQERAGYAPDSVRLEVSGKPITSDWIKSALHSVIYYMSSAKIGAYTVIGEPLNKGKFRNLSPGETLKLIIPVKVDGTDYIKSVSKARVEIENVSFKQDQPKLLLLSNKPEVIKEDGELFKAKLKVGTPARYFYHHMNATDNPPRHLYVFLENISAVPAKIFVSPVGAGPSNDELFVGHQAAMEYFYSRRNDLGWFITIKPGGKYLLERRPIKNGQTVSGLGYLSIVEGAEISFSVSSSTIPGKSAPENAKPHVEKPDVKTSKGVFPATIELSPIHTIGDKFTFIYIGGEPYEQDITTGEPNYGNYGALYNINLTIQNNQAEERDAWVYYVPRGGVSRAIFEIDGKLFETPLASPAQKVLLKKVKVAPNSKENVRLVTMPQGGAFYPVKVVVESEYIKK